MEQKPKECLIIDPPNELVFIGPFTRPVVTIMKLKNTNENWMLFKIKTTAPKRYCVRPNFGIVPPNAFIPVEICLQPFDYDANEKNKHKFMVQYMTGAAEGEMECTQQWKEADPKDITDVKLKCVFEMPTVYSNADTSASVAKETLPKATAEEKISNLQTSEQSESATLELRQLREENSNLRKELLHVKDQVVRLRCTPTKTVKDVPYEPFAPYAEKQIPMFYIAISIAAAIFGLLLGKYLL